MTALIRSRERYKLHYNRGLTSAKNGDFHGAIESLLFSASLNPRQEQSYMILGKLFAQRNDYETAQYYFCRAQEIAPNNEKIARCIDKIEQIVAEGEREVTEKKAIARQHTVQHRRRQARNRLIVLLGFLVTFIGGVFFGRSFGVRSEE